MFLTELQIIQLTGKKRPSAQIRALNSMGISHFVRPDGVPVIALSALQQPHKISKYTGPYLEAIQ